MALRFNRLLIIFGWAFVTATMLWPTAALLGSCVTQQASPSGGFVITLRQLELLWRSTWLSAVATATSVGLAIPIAFLLGRSNRLTDRPKLLAAMLATLLCPPMVFVFGWQRVLPHGLNAHVSCILVWTLWAWPIPAMVVGSGWSRVGRCSYEAALLTTSPPDAFIRGALPLILPHVGLSALIVFLLFFGDYGVPHGLGLVVLATDLLSRASVSTRTIETVWASLPSLGVIGLSLAGVMHFVRRCAIDEEPGKLNAASRESAISSWFAFSILVLTWGPPLAGLAVRMGTLGVLPRAMSTYGGDMVATLGVCLVAALGLAVAAAGLSAFSRGRKFVLVVSMILGTLPGAVVGEAVVAAYNHRATAAIYDHWPVVAVAYAARFGWLGMLAAEVVARDAKRPRTEQARTDGATESRIVTSIHLPSQIPLLVSVLVVATVLSVADVAASTLVRVPSFGPIAHVIIEKFHRFEDSMMISLSLILVAAGVIGGCGILWVVRRNR